VSDPLGTYFPFVPGQSLGSHDASGFVGGGQIGCDYQVGTWVVGLQGMFEWTNDMTGYNLQPGGGVFNQTQIPWFTTATGRIGYTPTLTTLVYLKGGGAWVRDNYTSYAPGNLVVASGGGTRSGWTVGGGIEQGTGTGWTAFVEYNYLNFGTNTVTFNANAAPAFQFPVDVRQDMHMVVVGVNYRFSAGRY
jgi:outer membrane immunogenic protein